VDAGLHHLQGKAKLVKAAEMLEVLREFHRDKLALRQRHVAAARHVKDYELNNTYQYVIAREDVQLGWLIDAVIGMSGRPDDVPEPEITPSGKGAQAQKAILEGDRDAGRKFADKWKSRIDALPNARHRSMLGVIIGETLEHVRFFEQALAGRTDLLGRRADGAGTKGDVLPTRWVE
jgi:hypothetical protein